MTTTGYETFKWEQLAKRQKIYIAAALVLLVVVLGYGAYDRFRLYAEVREFENAAIVANREKEEALELAAKVASQIKIREEELVKVEGKRDEKKQDVERSAAAVGRDRAEYDRAVRERLPNVPSTEQLCSQLKSLGYPCQPR